MVRKIEIGADVIEGVTVKGDIVLERAHIENAVWIIRVLAAEGLWLEDGL